MIGFIRTYIHIWMEGRSFASLPVTLHRKRIYILPTRYGLLFILMVFGMLLGSVNHNNNLGFLLTFLLSAMFFVSMLHTYRNILGIRILTIDARPVFAGSEAVFEFHVHTDSRARTAVEFGFADQDPTMAAALEPNSSHHIRVFHKTTSRGILNPGSAVISTQYPLGLFRAWTRLYPNLSCLVYPRPFPAVSIRNEGNSSRQGVGTHVLPGVDDFMGLRSYQPGDALQHMSWKTFSRGQGLFTKVFSGISGSSVILDWRAVKTKDTERKLAMLCDLVLKAHRERLTYGLWVPGTRIEPKRGEAHKQTCLKTLALFSIAERK